MEQYKEITELLLKHLRQELTPEESAHLTTWMEQNEQNRRFIASISNTADLMTEIRMMNQIDTEEAWKKVQAQLPDELKVVRMKWWRYAAAAVMLLFVSFSLYLWLKPGKPLPKRPAVVKALESDAKPTTTHATLTLDNGETIALDSLTSGLLAMQGNMKVEKRDNGALSYSAGGQSAPDKVLYNKVTVPRGSDVVYLQLSDGSKVWLNAASSIRYPVVFNEEERKVEITGEAYFEVARSPGLPPALPTSREAGKQRPFIVSNGDMNVVVLGTKFNVNTYENEENIKVTLLEGSVKVQWDKLERTIKPGQQAIINEAKINVENEVDLEQVMAWKQGKFVFNNTNIQLIMRQMERWYDLEPTKFEQNEDRQWAFNGEISRYNNATKVLQLLEETGSVKFRIEGKKITVSKQ